MREDRGSAVIRVLIADHITHAIELLDELPTFSERVEVIGVGRDPATLVDDVAEQRPDVLLLGEGFAPVDVAQLARRLSAVAPGTRILALGTPASGAPLPAGAAPVAWLEAGAGPEAVAQAMESITTAEPAAAVALQAAVVDMSEEPIAEVPVRRVKRPGRSRGEVLQVFSGKGGVGKTLLATNLAVALATDTEARVVLVDLDLQFGDVSVLLSIENHLTSIDDLSQQGEQVEPEFLDEVLATGPEGMRVLLAPSSPEFADLVTTGNLRSILRELTRAYDYIVIDSPAHLDERTLEAVELADQIILVTGYNVTSVKNTKITMRLLEAMGVEHERMVVVLNQTRPKVSFTAEEIEKSLRSRVLASLPYEPRVDEAIDTGRPVLTIDPRSELARQIYRIVDYLTATPGEAAEAAGGQDRERRANRRRFSLGRR